MRKTAATVLILGAAWIGYTAWPVYDLLVLVRAIETRDVDTLTRHVYFDAVRSVPSHVPALAVALATRRGHPPGDHQNLLGDELVKATRTR